MGSIREFLDDNGFDWKTGSIALHYPSDGWHDFKGSPQLIRTLNLSETDDRILNEFFDKGAGSADCPRYVAYDNNLFPRTVRRIY